MLCIAFAIGSIVFLIPVVLASRAHFTAYAFAFAIFFVCAMLNEAPARARGARARGRRKESRDQSRLHLGGLRHVIGMSSFFSHRCACQAGFKTDPFSKVFAPDDDLLQAIEWVAARTNQEARVLRIRVFVFACYCCAARR